MSAEVAGNDPDFAQKIDWLDIRFSLCIGILYASLKTIELLFGNPGDIGGSLGDIVSIICVAYILWRAQRQPEKLREWGLTTPITGTAFTFFAGLFVVAIAALASVGLALSGSLKFEISYPFRMIDYISGAFPQQFLVFAVGVTNLEKIPMLCGRWRLPLLLGALFCLAHLFLPGAVWIKVLVTFPLGFFATYYFLRFRTIIPLTAIHAVGFVLLVNWVEKYM